MVGMFKEKFWQRFWHIAESKGAKKTLILVSFTEAIFFPLPPDLLLIPMGLAEREKVFSLAHLTLLTSVLGGLVGYFLGYFFMDTLGQWLISLYSLEDKYIYLQTLYQKYQVLAVGIAGLTPVPYKLCTLTAGTFKLNLGFFLLVSTLSRGLRFYLIAALIYWKGEQARVFLEKRLDLVLTLTVLLIILGFGIVKFLK
ncbi:MAG: hypothetical protein PWR24_1959 [Desulfonauticus sp.]|nr:hypothetical protein [Desulfonauticus sp.]